MAVVRFGDVVKDVKLNVDRSNNPYLHYIAGDHMYTEDLTLRRKGTFATDDVGPAFIRIFKTGQVLYGSRRTYLKKVAVADFEGITANTTFVFETKDEDIFTQKLLPFLMLSDEFTKWSIKRSKGSTNPYILFSDLANYEFDLPPIAQQRVLADKLWAAYNLKEAYKKMIAATDEMVKSQFIEMFGIGCERFSLESLSAVWLKGQSFKKDEIIDDGINQCIHYGELFTKYGAIINVVSSRTNAIIAKSSNVGDILFPASDVTPNGLARCSVVMFDNVLLGGDIIIMRPQKRINPQYLSYAINAQKEQLLSRVTGSVVKHLSGKSLKSVTVPIPSLNMQDKYVTIAQQADKSKSELRQAIDNIEKVMKSLLQ